MAKRMIVAAAWLVAAVWLVAGPAWAAEPQSGPKTTYYAVYMAGDKVGYEKDERTAADGRVTTNTTMFMSMNRMGVTMEATILGSDVETADGKPLRFGLTQKLGGMTMTVSGVVDAEGQMTLSSDTGGVGALKKTEKRAWPAGALLAEGERLLQRKKGLAAGTKYEYQIFDPESQQANRVEMTVGGKETIDIAGRKVEATRLSSILHQPGGDVPSTEWVDGDCEILRTEASMMGTPLVMERCDEVLAKSPAKNPGDLFAAMLLTCPEPIPAGAKKVTLTLKVKEGKKPAILETDTQKVRANADGTVTITVEALPLPKGQARPYAGQEAAALAALKPARYVQSDDELIVTKAEQIVGSNKDAAESAMKLAAWVHSNMTQSDLRLVYASASEVIRNHNGDCKEYSVLLTALCRAAGIPARTAVGYLYVADFMGHSNVFGGHQWTQVYLGGKWIDLDATRQAPYNTAGRITLAVGNGNSDDMVQLVNTMGSFTITSAAAEKATPAGGVKSGSAASTVPAAGVKSGAAANVAPAVGMFQMNVGVAAGAGQGLPPGVFQPAPEGLGLVAVAVAGVQISWFDVSEWDDANGPNQTALPANQRQSYNLTLAGKFAAPVYQINGGKLEKVVTDAGEDLLEQNVSGFYPSLRQRFENGKRLAAKVFTATIRLPVPSEKATTIKELSGRVFYTVLGKSKMVNLGVTEFKTGAKGTKFDAEIESLEDNPRASGKLLKLNLTDLPEIIGEIKFYDEDGTALTVQNWGQTTGNAVRTFMFNRAEVFPAKGRIEIELYDDVKKLAAPFKLENVPLFGRPARPGA
jgi:hypothetical protein